MAELEEGMGYAYLPTVFLYRGFVNLFVCIGFVKDFHFTYWTSKNLISKKKVFNDNNMRQFALFIFPAKRFRIRCCCISCIQLGYPVGAITHFQERTFPYWFDFISGDCDVT